MSPAEPVRTQRSLAWRSILFVPVTNDRFLAKAHQRGADAIQLDLEDSVPLAAKEDARARLPAAVDLLVGRGVDVVVRINRPWLDAIADLKAAVRPGVLAITLPKVDDAGRVRAIDELIAELERAAGMRVGGIRLILLIESPAALPRLAEIAASSTRVMAMTLGPEDYALAAGCGTGAEALMLPNMLVAQACAAAGIRPLGFVGSIGDFSDPQAFRETIRRARQLGFAGAAVIHPAQVAILNEEFSPSAQECAWAERVIEAARRAEGLGAFEVDGKMIDKPIIERALRVLEQRR
jgi:citrate lyase subunit beta/citryl-CoA lyase